MIRALAGTMAVVAGVVWLLILRWERPGARAGRQVTLHPPRLVRHGFELGLLAQLAYPVLVAVMPDRAYAGPANWSSRFDVPMQVAGAILWGIGMAVLLQAAWVMRRYFGVDGLAVDHRLVTDGPYRYVRHPAYGAFMAIALGTTLVFRSYVLVGASAAMIFTALWWAREEENLLASDPDIGDAYRRYAHRTGRFLPRLRPARTPSA